MIFDCCPNLIRTLPTLNRDKNDPEVVNTDEEDHPFDGLTYGLQWHNPQLKRRRLKGT